MVNITDTATLVVFVNDPSISPAPLSAIPVTIPLVRSPLSLDQLFTAPVTLPLNPILVMADPLHIVCEVMLATALGSGLTSIVAVNVAPVQVIPALV